ncbi:MAG TPA: hypothetical protein VFA59_09825, partial [Vicinamibacterales bacterium]|nr:hypothetical protein [Vicinamibacterales bacterium]
TLSGCVANGTKADTLVLTDITEVRDGKKTNPQAIYWLTSTRELEGHVGEEVEVKGTYSPSHDAGKTAKVVFEENGATGDATITVENNGAKAETKLAERPVGTSGMKTEVTKPSHQVDVQSVRATGSCR